MKDIVVTALLIIVVVFMASIVLGWHEPDGDSEQWFDGASYRARCRHCGADIMQDSQGNWF